MKKKAITVFTPTYNRAYIISNLYISLCNQKFKDFEWLIIDDGSTDDTKSLVEKFIGDRLIDIKYVYKENEGKAIAINKAAELANGKWLFIVDSDDYLLDNSLDAIMKYCDDIEDDDTFAGVVGLRSNASGKVWTSNINKDHGTQFEMNKVASNKEFIDATVVKYRFKYKIQGDRAEVIRTSLLKKYPFPKIEGDTFMPESYLWLSLSRDGYKFRWFNKIVYITEYLEDGLTKNGRELAKKNSKARSFLENFVLTIPGIPVIMKLRNGINYYRYGIYSGQRIFRLFLSCNRKVFGVICLIPSMILNCYEGYYYDKK